MDRLHALIHKSNIEYITTRSYDGEKHSSVCTTVLYNSVSLVRYLEHGIRVKFEMFIQVRVCYALSLSPSISP